MTSTARQSRQSHRRLCWAALAALLTAVGAPRPAGAQAPPVGDVGRARELFVQASEQRDQGDTKGALDKFRAAHALAANPVTAFELGGTYALLGQLVEAREAYLSVARLPVQPGETERATLARRDAPRLAEDLRSRLATLSVKIPSAPGAAVSITVDGEGVAAAALTAPWPVNPGAHHVVATGTGGDHVEQDITLKEGESREVDLVFPPGPGESRERAPAPLQVAPPPVDAAPRQTGSGGGNHFGPFSYAGFGVGVAGFVTGTVLAAAALSKASSADCSHTSCSQSAIDDLQSARDLVLASVVSYVIAGVGVGVGVADVVLYRPGPKSTTSEVSLQPWIGAGAAGVRGSF
jgi:hypothetical protein